MDEGIPVRIRTARAQSKARNQLRELLRDTSLVHSMVVACNAAGEWTVLTGGLTGRDMGEAVAVAVGALERVLQQETKHGAAAGPIALDTTVEPGPLGARLGKRRKPEIAYDGDGLMVAPPGEQFISCAECGVNRWFATVTDQGTSARLACIRCGNEIKDTMVVHQAGTA